VRTETQPEPHPEEDLLHRILEGAQQFLARNWLHLVLVAAVVVAAAVGLRAYQYRRQSHLMRAWGELGSLPVTELRMMLPATQAAQLRQEALVRLEDLIRNSPKSAATPWVLLQLGALRADAGDWAGAANAYSELVNDYAESEAAAAARPALATCLESLGKYRDAARAFEKLADQGEPFYLLAAGRCRELAGELGAARQLYERLAGDETLDEGLIRVAQARLSDLARGKRLPPPPPLAPRQGAGAPLPSVVLPAPADTTLGPVAAPQPAGPEREMD